MLNFLVEANIKNLNNEQIYDLYEETKDDVYLTELLEKNRGAIYSIAIKFWQNLPDAKKYQFEVDDFYLEGVLGYMEGLKRYDKKRGAKVNSACFFWCFNAISKYFHKNNKIISYPDNYRKLIKKIDVKEIDKDLTMSVHTHYLLMQYSSKTIDIDDFSANSDIKQSEDESLHNPLISLIINSLSEEDKKVMDKALVKGYAKSNRVVKMISATYWDIKNQLQFTKILLRDGEYLMSNETRNDWLCGSVETEFFTFNASDIYNIEKSDIGFVEHKLKNGYYLLKVI